jgi:hydrogenase-4 component B
MFFLSALAVIFGLAATPIIKLLAKVAGAALGIDSSSMSFSLNNFVLNPLARPGIYLSTPGIALALLTFGFLGFIAYKAFNREKSAVHKTWGCGYYKLGARNEYTATAFSKPFRIAFSFFLLPYRKTQKIRESFYHVKSFSYETHTTPVFRKYIYYPLLAGVLRTAKFMRRMQPGSIHLYLAYIFITVLLLVIFMYKF